ncbi:fimbria/pilus outer membrane usher protein [Chitinimonas viridis]|uniref:Fimbria/pilus outer membrane usher protein n=1 Tax=Chitinimonas viridis TaxID=664880 RepID=A0ABT8B070_9NEIS|nr:fimbria/pilus outer membrane usher protein [Chitinimonas viridis]MDN3575230.1 fimbria/pilus outer membrane usher protein [Chitinimonas viridis]
MLATSLTHAATLLALSPLFVVAANAAETMPLAPAYRPVILAVTINDLVSEGGTVFWEGKAGELWVPVEFLRSWNIDIEQQQVIGIAGVQHANLALIKGLHYQRDHTREELAITASAEAFTRTRIDLTTLDPLEVAPYAPGAALGYDLSSSRSGGIDAHQALLEVGLFQGSGMLSSSFLGGSERNVRLLTTYQTDQTDTLKTLRLGDSYSGTGAWGYGVLFGGLQYGTNFSIRPDLVTMPMPGASGSTRLPSTVDVYVNDVLRARQAVRAGPFTVQGLPVISGAGEVQVIVTDMLGREQRITQSFFANPNLLRPGLVQENYEFGWLRQDYGLRSNAYHNPFASLTYRKGLSDSLTGELRGEIQKNHTAIGLSAATLSPALSSTLESTIVASRTRGENSGLMGSVAYRYLGQRWSASARMQLNSQGFRQLGSDPDNLPRQLATAQVSAPIGQGAMALNYLHRKDQGNHLTRIINLSYSQRLSPNTFASFTLLKPVSPKADLAAALMLTMVFDSQHVASASLKHDGSNTTGQMVFQKTIPADSGTGYRLITERGSSYSRQDISVMQQASFGRFRLDLVRLQGKTSTRLGAQGGIEFIGGRLYFSRDLDQGFALVQVPGTAGIPVYLENRLVGHTDQEGRVVVGNLQAYQANHISIDPLYLPLESSVGEIRRAVIPRRQGGVVVDFNIHRLRGATLSLVLSDGTPLPAWTPVEVLGMQQSYVTGKRGEVFVDLPASKGNKLFARPVGLPACELTVDLPEAGLTIPKLGPLICLPIP